MPQYEWSKEYNAWVKFCTRPDCPDSPYIGTADEAESFEIFKRAFGFASGVRNADGLQGWCYDCRAADRHKRDRCDKQLILAQQNHRCAIPGCEEEISFSGQTAQIDHSHRTGKVRGIVCRRHNTILGRIEGMMQLIKDETEHTIAYLNQTDPEWLNIGERKAFGDEDNKHG